MLIRGTVVAEMVINFLLFMDLCGFFEISQKVRKKSLWLE